MPSVYVTRIIPKPGTELLTEAGWEIGQHDSDEAIEHEALVAALKEKKYDCLLCMLTDKIDAEVLDAAGDQLKIVASMSVGYDHIDLEECAKRKILVSNSPGVSEEAVAETCVALMLMAARRLPEGVEAVKNGEWGDWKPSWLCGTELTGSVLGIYGLGKIGYNIAYRLLPFDFSRMIYTDKYEPDYAIDLGVERVDFDELLEKSDFIVIACNLTAENHHIFNLDAFSKMKSTAIVMNVARGGIIDHDDLNLALESGKVGGAALDVTEPEPLPMDHPLVLNKKCTILPHMGSNTVDAREKMSLIAARCCIAAAAGEVPEGNVTLPEVE